MSTTAPVAPPAAPDTVNIEIDGVAMTAPKGSMIIHASDKAGIPIPRFCYHEKLPIAANCRMCLVDVEKMPKPAPACATPVMEGMKVYTRTRRALDAQRNVMEFLLVNHPLDCPICDQGGECELQDVSMGYGRSVSRYVDRKRVIADEDMGPLVATDMTRCIQCTRCIRFTADVAGTFELGGMSRGEKLQIGTYDGKPLMSELSGNVIDVCPVGALTNKPFRFKARAWELVARDSIGYHDALGSNLHLHVHRGQVVRTVPRDNEAVNECWLSDRDRYSHEGLYAADRALVPMVREGEGFREAEWEEALPLAAKLLREAGPDLAVLAGAASTNEEGAMLAALAAGLGTPHLDHRLSQLDFSDGAVAEAFAMPSAALEKAAAVLLVGCNIRHELPLLHQRLLKASKHGAKIFSISPVDFEFAFALAGSTLVPPSRMAATLEQGGDFAEALRAAGGNAVIVLGELAENHAQAARIRAAARALAQGTGARLNRVPQGANAVGLAAAGVLPGPGGRDAGTLAGASGFLLFGVDPQHDFADNAQSSRAMAGKPVVAFSAYASEALRAVADLILPIGLLPEIEGTLTNIDGLAQSTAAGGRLPGQARPGWRVLRAMADALALPGFEFTDLGGLRAQMQPRAVAAPSRSAAPVAGAATDALERVAPTAIYRADAVLRRAPALNAHPLTAGPRILLNPADAAARNLAEGAMAKLSDGTGTAVLPVALSARVAPGCAVVERGYDASAPLSPSAPLDVRGA
jgi:NADH-quinone oxidoreductase subunit G